MTPPWPPIEPKRTRVRFPDPNELGDEWVVGVTRVVTPGMVLKAVREGIFPWPTRPGLTPWASPEPRTIFPLERAGRWPRTVARDLKRARERWTVTFDEAFPEVMRACAVRPGQGTWITDEMIATYCALHELGWAHSIEVWQPVTSGLGLVERNPDELTQAPGPAGEARRLIGGLYGVAIGALFAGESMFHAESGASKVAFARMAEHLQQRGFRLFDVQAHTEHLASLGCVEVARRDYLAAVREAVQLAVPFV